MPARRSVSNGVAALLVGVCVFTAACSDEGTTRAAVTRQSPAIPMDSGTVRITTATDTFQVSVEIAESGGQRAFGLMERDHLPVDEGMVFVYEEPIASGFYMYRTRIPLDIAFYDQSGRIISVHTMTPCASPNAAFCEDYRPAGPYIGALEVNAGYFADRGIGLGDEIVLRRADR